MFEDILPYLPSPQTIIVIVGALIVLAYITIYFGGRLYNRQGFVNQSRVVMETAEDKPYTTTPIMKLADYDNAVELDVVANVEGSKEEATERINKLLSARPYDWSSLPPAARTFQEKQANWLLGAAGNSMASNAVNFGAHVNESFVDSVQPPDYDSIEEEEQRILATYVPEKSANLSKYSAEDVNTLIERIYTKKGLIAEVKEAPNGVYEVVSTHPINEKVVYEDDANVVREGGGAAATIQVPAAAAATAAGLDPFYEPQTSMRTGRSQYMQWTPGLERMFAPTYDKVNWY